MKQQEDINLGFIKNKSIIRSFLFFAVTGLVIVYFYPEVNGYFMYPPKFPYILFLVNFTTLLGTFLFVKSKKRSNKQLVIAKFIFFLTFIYLTPIILVAYSHELMTGFWIFPAVAYILISREYSESSLFTRFAKFSPITILILHIIICGRQPQDHHIFEILFTLFIFMVFIHLSSYLVDVDLKDQIVRTNEMDLEDFLDIFSLTTREKQVYCDLLVGLSATEIGIKYSISEGTARNHIQNIYKKLQINNRTKLVNMFRTQFENREAIQTSKPFSSL